MSIKYQKIKERNNEINSFGNKLIKRCKSKCEICSSSSSLTVFEVPPVNEPDIEICIMICEKCKEQFENQKKIDPNHWFCLNESIWSEFAPVQVMAYRMLVNLEDQSWAKELLEQVYLEESVLEWAKNDGSKKSSSQKVLDSNGNELDSGDSVSIIKDLDVKGVSFVAKRGTIVKNIKLTDDPTHVEGKVNKTSIFLKTIFLKKL